MSGFCGAFTTFSTFILESVNLLKEGEIWRASLNLIGSVVLGCAAFIVAEAFVKAI